MSLRKKFILSVLLLCLGLLGPMAYSSARAVLLNFQAVEKYFITDDLNRVENTLRAQFSELENEAQNALHKTLPLDTLLEAGSKLFPTRLAAHVDFKSAKITSKNFPPEGSITSLPLKIEEQLFQSLDRLVNEKSFQSGVSGLLKIGDQYYIIGLALTADKQSGMLLGKPINEFAERLGRLQGTTIQALSSLTSTTAYEGDFFNIDSERIISIYRTFPDIFGQKNKFFLSVVRTERPIYDEGLKALMMPFILILAVGILALLFMNFFFEKLILQRLKIVQNIANSVAKEWQVDLRIPLRGNDEITRLAISFNTMLGTLEQLIENVPDPLILSDSSGRILLVNVSICELLEYRKEELRGASLNTLLHSEGENPKGPDYIRRTEEDIFEGSLLHSDQKRIPVEVHQEKLYFDDNILTLSIARDLRERKLMEDRLVQMAFYDAQTGLPNRHYFLDELEKEIQNISSIPYYSICVVVLNFDKFRLVIEQLGPRNADQLMTDVIRRIEGMISGFATTFRMSGDEFALIIRGTNSKDYVESLLTRLQRIINMPVQMEGKTIFPSASFGVVLDIQSGDTSASIISRAAKALVKGKERGIGIITFYSKDIDEEKNKSADDYNVLTAQADIQKGLSSSEFVPYFQPIYEISPQRLAGFETLVRWNHPNQGFLSPHSFIPLAEETGLIFELDKYIIQQSIQIVKKWSENFPQRPIFVSANASGTTFKNPDFFPFLEALLDTEKIDPRCFVLEITEGILLENLDRVRSKLNRLRELGIKIALDDFGTGYSSLQYISQLPIDYIKIDKSFIDQLFMTNKSSRMVQSIINMAEELGMGVVAEGVESEDQFLWLSEKKNLKGQGYFFSRPVPLAEAESFLTDALLFEDLSEKPRSESD